MAASSRTRMEPLPNELAERVRTAVTGVVGDFEALVSTLGSRLRSQAAPGRRELQKLVATLRKSLDRRLAALERALQDRPAAKAKSKAKPAARKTGAVRKAAPRKTVRRKTAR